MLFNSFDFLIFFVVVTSLYFALPHKYRWFLLLVASCYFYMAFVPVYILILGFTIVIDYFAGIWLENATGRRRKMLLVLSLVANIGVLAVFKYYNFINENITTVLYGAGFENPIPYLSILLPIGLSFHTFQAMSYTIEVYRGHQTAERNFGIYALYVMFYPQLVAGPIERPQNLLHQFYEKHEFDIKRVASGLKLMMWGFFKKLIIADRLSIYVDTVYNHPENCEGITFIVATIFFAFQIYCDFSGYSDIAIGSARVMGFKLMENFRRPYFSQSISEFWKRWHISLSTWFSDYLYRSMGGNRVSVPRWYFNLFFVFLVSGLWHGANWTYVIWGALNGFYLIFAIVRKKMFAGLQTDFIRLPEWLTKTTNILVTFVLICFSWIFFRARNVDEAFYIIRKIAAFEGPLFITNPNFFFSILGIIMLMGVEFQQEFFKDKISLLNHPRAIVRYATYTLIIILILMMGVFDGSQFIYFQF
ncbi:MBOAT family O-acyltransferase [Flavihumibacter solisilvae]|uniref:Alginate O-acetyltransferase n=1 Tax=Flavihumibacter solisilvae TaxID=1349421 RepID=A0A0C1L3W5_9BACT|nr:MBOAT family O-acyltransferase [Flavihumibacter solisilvae]KIC94316.1 alginate O-acetyltransferase [Flavihumibacter solisilvae]